MRILAHIHTFNDADIIDCTIEALVRQTRPVDRILVVDNASTDGTLDRPSLKHATVLRQTMNGGTSGAVYNGFRYSLENDYDWIWVFDADSVPEPNALEKLLELYASFPASLQDETAFVACLHHNVQDGVPRYGGLFTERGHAPNRPVEGVRHCTCHFTIWSGCLYRLAAVRKIGLPNPDYVLDWGEGEYGYRVLKAGYKGFIDQESILRHNIRGYTSSIPADIKIGPATISFYEYAPIRCYYSARNMVYFILYDAELRSLRLILRTLLGVSKMTVNFLVRPRRHGKQIVACFRGIWDGLTGNVTARY
jgi:GT2 family glycosyltransferase